MRNREKTSESGFFSPGARRYEASRWRETGLRGEFGPPAGPARDRYMRAIRELSSEDEDLIVPEGRGPIVFKDGIFQIDLSDSEAPPPIDPALKGLIDSILDIGRSEPK